MGSVTAEPLDLGDGHTLRFTAWAPERDIPANAERYAGIPDVDRFGAIVTHPIREGDTLCEGRRKRGSVDEGCCIAGITFAGDVQRRIAPDRPSWTVESWDPLTISPSLLCHCGDHGFIREGRWVAA